MDSCTGRLLSCFRFAPLFYDGNKHLQFLKASFFEIQISNQARWAVLESFKLLKENRQALDVVVRSLYEGGMLGAVIRDLEESLSKAASM